MTAKKQSPARRARRANGGAKGAKTAQKPEVQIDPRAYARLMEGVRKFGKLIDAKDMAKLNLRRR